MRSQSEKAAAFLALHHGPGVLVLPNAWDCASARIFEEAGFPAAATTSAGVAFSLGYPDRQRIPRQEMLAAVKRIAACVEVPLTADLEGGYDDITETARGLVEAGAVGLNLEDTVGDALVEIDRQAQKIAAVRLAGEQLGVRIVINARTDLYLAAFAGPDSRFDRICERLKAYIDAGADCGFIPGVTDEELIGRFTRALQFPLNFLAGSGSPSIARFKELGVARVSVGSGPARAAMGLTRRIAEELKTTGTYANILHGTFPYPEANRLFGG